MSNKFRKLFLIIGDVLILYTSLYVTLLIRYGQHPTPEYWLAHFYPFTFLFVIWILIFFISELYKIDFAVSNSYFFRLALRSIIIGGIFAALFFYITPGISIAPKTNLILFIIIYCFLFFIWRSFFHWLIRTQLPGEVLALIGYNKEAEDLIGEIERKPHLGYQIAFIMNLSENELNLSDNIPVLSSSDDDLKNAIIQNNVTTLILASDPSESEPLSKLLFSCLSLKLSFISLSHFYEEITGKVPLELINRIWFLENLREGNRYFYDIYKRISDLILSITCLLVTIPLWLLIAILIKFSSKGSIFFKQKRIGRNDQEFVMLKFRTMRIENNDFSPTEENDRRITGIGRFLRKTRLDELPQLLNIIKGEMSFVGPRPERPELVEKLEKKIAFYNERMLVKPGLTGWDQVSNVYHSPSYEDTLEKLQYDLYYVKNRSFYLDAVIIMKTIGTVFSRSGR
jgi:exopolysaccharide biosynthesis polyprenyl glycosylphosphotransferase